MPRTKLDQRVLTPAEVRSRILRSAADRAGLHRDRDLAEILNLSCSCMSNRMSGIRAWGVEELDVLARRLKFTDDEIVRFVRGRL